MGRAHKNQRVRLLIADDQVHVVDADGVLLRQMAKFMAEHNLSEFTHHDF